MRHSERPDFQEFSEKKNGGYLEDHPGSSFLHSNPRYINLQLQCVKLDKRFRIGQFLFSDVKSGVKHKQIFMLFLSLNSSL